MAETRGKRIVHDASRKRRTRFTVTTEREQKWNHKQGFVKKFWLRYTRARTHAHHTDKEGVIERRLWWKRVVVRR